MRTVMAGIAGWARVGRGRSEALRTVDTALTVVGTLLAALTIMLLRG